MGPGVTLVAVMLGPTLGQTWGRLWYHGSGVIIMAPTLAGPHLGVTLLLLKWGALRRGLHWQET